MLALVTAGLRNKEIAARLGITENTVKFHLRNILDKLHAESRTDPGRAPSGRASSATTDRLPAADRSGSTRAGRAVRHLPHPKGWAACPSDDVAGRRAAPMLLPYAREAAMGYRIDIDHGGCITAASAWTCARSRRST